MTTTRTAAAVSNGEMRSGLSPIGAVHRVRIPNLLSQMLSSYLRIQPLLAISRCALVRPQSGVDSSSAPTNETHWVPLQRGRIRSNLPRRNNVAGISAPWDTRKRTQLHPRTSALAIIRQDPLSPQLERSAWQTTGPHAETCRKQKRLGYRSRRA